MFVPDKEGKRFPPSIPSYNSFVAIRSSRDVQEYIHETFKSSSLFFQLVNCAVKLCYWVSPELLLGMHWGEELAVFPSHCRRKACTRDDNKVSRQRNCATASNRSTMFCDVLTTICTASCLHEESRTERWTVSVMVYYMDLFELVLVCRSGTHRSGLLFYVIWVKLKSSFLNTYFQQGNERRAAWMGGTIVNR